MSVVTITIQGLKYEKHNNGWHLTGGYPDNQHVKIPEAIGELPVVEISDFAFQLSSAIIHVEIPESIRYIGRNAFQGCSNLISLTVFKRNNRMPFLKNNVMRIASHAFEGCYNLQHLYLPFVTLTHGGFQFHGCWELISLGNHGVITGGAIDNTAFSECEKLKMLMFADDVFFEAEAFQTCKNLETLKFVDGEEYNLNAFIPNLQQYTFICKKENNIVELAYLGAKVEVVT